MRALLRFVGAAALGLTVLGGCYGQVDLRSKQPGDAAPLAPAAALDRLESELLHAPSARLRFTLSARGPVPAQLAGSLLVTTGNRVELEATGTLRGQPASPKLASNGQHMEGGSLEKTFAADAPAALSEAVVLGFVRMGLLHNLANLSGGEAPEGADGTIRAYVTLSDVVRAPRDEVVRGMLATRYDFKMIVDGKPRGEATLWLNARTGLPIQRHTVVHFPDGNLEVDEFYDDVVLGQPVDPGAFETAPVPMEI